METTIKPKSLEGFVRSLSGLFINKDNPQGLTPKEIELLIQLLTILRNKKEPVINKKVKVELANMTNHSLQVITNYINKLKEKGVIQDTSVHPIFLRTKIIIQYGESPV